MHHQRLAAAGSHPVGELVELRPSFPFRIKRWEPVALRFALVPDNNPFVQGRKQPLRVAEISIKVDFGEEEGQILEVLPDNRCLSARNSPLVETLCVLDDILIVFEQELGGQLC